MTNDIIDTQDGYCIWQTTHPVNGRVQAFIRPVTDGIKNWAVYRKEEDGTFKSFGLYDSVKVALFNAKVHDAEIVRLVSGKFP